MPKLDSETRQVYIKTALILTTVLLLFGGWLWWRNIYMKPQNVFNDMLKNSLSTYGYTKSSKQDNPNDSFEQLTQVQFGERNLAEISTSIRQKTESGDTKVRTTTLATNRDTYVKYDSIEVPAVPNQSAPDFSQLIDVWGRQTKEEGGQSSFYDAVYGAVLVAGVPPSGRTELLNYIRQENFYKIDYGNVKTENVNNRPSYVYEAEIDIQKYVTLLQKFDKISGLQGTEGIDPATYKDSPPLKVKIFVDKQSRLLSRIVYDQEQDFTYGSYGIRTNVDTPTKAISRQELESKLQQTLGQ